nr:hypothetical protein Iba_chr10eCG2120 [Ipomoea batatas]
MTHIVPRTRSTCGHEVFVGLEARRRAFPTLQNRHATWPLSAVYKVPSELCRKALRKRRRRLAKNGGFPVWDDSLMRMHRHTVDDAAGRRCSGVGKGNVEQVFRRRILEKSLSED